MRIHFEHNFDTWTLWVNGVPYLVLSDDEMTEVVRAVTELKERQ